MIPLYPLISKFLFILENYFVKTFFTKTRQKICSVLSAFLCHFNLSSSLLQAQQKNKKFSFTIAKVLFFILWREQAKLKKVVSTT
jgi:hypothetical protein